MGNPSKITTSLAVDPPISQDANFAINTPADRQYVDNQIRGIQQHLVDSLIGGVSATWLTLDSGSTAVAVGDAVLPFGAVPGTVTRATAGLLATATTGYVVLTAASANGRVRVALGGSIPSTVTGLPATAGYARVSTTTGRPEYVASFSGGDVQLGKVTAAGDLAILGAQGAAGAAGSPLYSPTLDASAGVVPGDVIVTANSGALTKKAVTAQPFLGVSTTTTAASGTPTAQVTGLIPASVTGLGAGVESNAVVSSGRLIRKAMRAAADIWAGTVDTLGNVSPGVSKSVGNAPRNIIDVNLYKQVGDPDDTLAITRALAAGAASFVGGFTIFFPQRGSNDYVVSSTIRANVDNVGTYNGVHFLGEGGAQAGGVTSGTRILWNGSQPRGTAASLASKALNQITLTGLTAAGLAAVNIGDMIEIWGCPTAANNGRFPITSILSATSCTIYNAAGVAGETGSWLLEVCMLDIRASELHWEKLCFNAAPGAQCAASVNWTESPLVGSGTVTHPTFTNCAFYSDRGSANGLVAGARYGLRIGAQVVCPGKAGYTVDGNGVNVPQSPSNCDNGLFERVAFSYLIEGGIFIDNTNGNGYEHVARKCDFTGMQLGVRITNGAVDLYHPGVSNLGDALLHRDSSNLRLTIEGGHIETTGMIARLVGSGDDDAISIKSCTAFMDGPYRYLADVGQYTPRGLNPYGNVVTSPGVLVVENCSLDNGAGSLPLFFSGGGSTNSPARISIEKSKFGQLGGTSTSRPALTQTGRKAPWKLADAMTLIFKVNGGAAQTITIAAADVPDIGRVMPHHLSYLFYKAMGRAAYTNVTAYAATGLMLTQFMTTGLGPTASLQFTGGTAFTELGLDTNIHNGLATVSAAKSGGLVELGVFAGEIGITSTRIFDKVASKDLPSPDGDYRITGPCLTNPKDMSLANIVDGVSIVDVTGLATVDLTALASSGAFARTLKLVGWRNNATMTTKWPSDARVREVFDRTVGPAVNTITHVTADAKSAGIVILQGSNDRIQVDPTPYPEVVRLGAAPAAGWRPDQASALFWFTSPNYGIAAGASLPATLIDSSGNANNGTQAGTNTSALYVPNQYAPNSPYSYAPCPLWVGPGPYYTLPVLTIAQPFAVYFFIQPTAPQLMGIVSATGAEVYFDGANIVANAGTALSAPLANNAYAVVEVYFNGASSSITINRVAPVVGAAGAGTWTAVAPKIATRVSALTQAMNGLLDDVFVIANPSAATRASALKFLRDKWAQ